MEFSELLRKVERLELLLGALVLGIGGLFWGPGWALASAGLGVAAAALNFRGLVWLAQRIVGQGESRQLIYGLLFIGKFALLTALCYVLVVHVAVDLAPFLIGVSIMPVAVTVGAIQRMQETDGALTAEEQRETR
jgi:hypothetical protein